MARRSTNDDRSSGAPSTLTAGRVRPLDTSLSDAVSTTRPGMLITSPSTSRPAPRVRATWRASARGRSEASSLAARRHALTSVRASTARGPPYGQCADGSARAPCRAQTPPRLPGRGRVRGGVRAAPGCRHRIPGARAPAVDHDARRRTGVSRLPRRRGAGVGVRHHCGRDRSHGRRGRRGGPTGHPAPDVGAPGAGPGRRPVPCGGAEPPSPICAKGCSTWSRSS
jgi:hypothetical protein